MREDEKDFRPEEDDIGIIGEITEKNHEGLEKLAKEEKSREKRDSNSYMQKLKVLYRRYFRKSEAKTQTIKA